MNKPVLSIFSTPFTQLFHAKEAHYNEGLANLSRRLKTVREIIADDSLVDTSHEIYTKLNNDLGRFLVVSLRVEDHTRIKLSFSHYEFEYNLTTKLGAATSVIQGSEEVVKPFDNTADWLCFCFTMCNVF